MATDTDAAPTSATTRDHPPWVAVFGLAAFVEIHFNDIFWFGTDTHGNVQAKHAQLERPKQAGVTVKKIWIDSGADDLC